MHRVLVRRWVVAQVAALSVAGLVRTVDAVPLNPGSFTSLGTMNFTSGSITINTDTLGITGAAAFNGGTVSQGVGNPEVAVFTFTNFNIGAGVTVNVTGSRPLALLSQGTMTIASAISLNGGNAGVPTAGAAGPAGGYAGGTGGTTGSAGGGPGGGGGSGSSYDGGGGGFGGAGGAGDFNSIAGVSYGNLLSLLQGGSGGGGAKSLMFPASGGGGGGGAIELGAAGTLSIASSLTTNGGAGGDPGLGAAHHGGAAAGGGILLHAGTLAISSLSAAGGSTRYGGGGGGGRIALAGGNVNAATISGQVTSLLSSVNGGDSTYAGDGRAGVLTFRPDVATVQSTQSLNVGITPGQTGRADPRIEVLPKSLTVQGGGTATLISPITWGSGNLVSLTGGTLNVNNSTTLTTGSTLNWSGGSLIVGSGQTLAIDGGVASVTAGGRGLANGATLRITNGGQFDTNSYFDIGSSFDAGNGPTGTLLVDGSGSRFTTGSSFSLWGHNPGDFATITFSNQGTGSLVGGVQIASNGGQALLNLQSGAVLNVSSLLVGSGGGAATININSAALNNTGTALFLQGTRLDLTSGSITFGGNATFSAGSTLNWNSGNVIVAAGKTLSIDGGVVNVSQSGRSVTNGSTLRVAGGGKFSSAFAFDVASTSSATGSLNVDGSGSLFEVYGSFGRIAPNAGNAATVNLSNSAHAHYDAGLQVAASGGTALVNISSNASLSTANLVVGRATPGSVATINLNGGSLISYGPVAFREGVVVNYSAGALSAGGTLVTSGNAQVLLSTGGNKVLRTTGLNMSGTSKIDLADNNMIIDWLTPLATVQGYILTGRNGGNWLGNALTSSAAALDPTHKGLGVVDNAVLGLTTFSGQTVDASSILVKYTYLGDANLDGKVNTVDFNNLAGNFGGSGKVWLNGDFDYDGLVSSTDFNLLAGNFGRTLAPAAPLSGPQLGSIVPEPATAMIVFPAVALSTRQKRRFGRDPVNTRP